MTTQRNERGKPAMTRCRSDGRARTGRSEPVGTHPRGVIMLVPRPGSSPGLGEHESRMFQSLARFTYRYRWYVIIAWILLLVASIPILPRVPGELAAGGFSSPHTE